MLQKMLMFIGCLLLLSNALPARAAEQAADNLGFTFMSLGAEDLDAIEKQLGYRVGVLVDAVAPDSVAEKAGFKVGDVLFVIGKTGVDSAKAAEAALKDQSGTVDVMGMRQEGAGDVKTFTMKLPLSGAKVTNTEEKTPPQNTGADNQAKLKALEEAHNAGILSDDEYKKKKAELQPKAPAPIDPATAEKLKALDRAHDAGVLSDAEYQNKRAALLKTDSKSTTTSTPKPSDTKSTTPSTPGKGGVYQHVMGLSIAYPNGWTVKPSDDGISLIPAKPAMVNGSHAEAYFITGLPASGLTDVNDPQVIAFLDQLVAAKISPALQRTKEPEAIRMSNGQGVALSWEVQGQKGVVHVTAYATIMRGFGIIVGAFGVKEHVLPRLAEVKSIFSSLKYGEGKHDQAVVGAWRLFSTRTLRNEDNLNFSSDDPARASSVSDQQSTLQLLPDGSAVRISISRTIAGGGAAGSGSKVWIDTGDQKEQQQGKWFAGDGTLFIMWDNGDTSSWQYGLVKDAGGVYLKLNAGNQVEFWRGQ